MSKQEFPIGKAVYRGRDGNLHWAIGAVLVKEHPRSTFCMWTACGNQDIPANEAWYYRDGEDTVDCEDCLGVEADVA